MRNRQVQSEAELRALLPGNDGAVVERLRELDVERWGDAALEVRAVLDVILTVAVAFKSPLALTTAMVEGLSKLDTVSDRLAAWANAMPTDARSAFDVLVGGQELSLYKYVACLRCGELQRGEFQEACACPDGGAWGSQGKRTSVIRMFSLLDIIKHIFSVPALAEAMNYVNSPGYLGGEVKGHRVDYHGTTLYQYIVSVHRE